jgi:hypothetical protein
VSGLTLSIDVSGLPIRVQGIPAELRESLEDAWAGFVVPPMPDPILDVFVEEGTKRLTPGRVMVGGILGEAGTGRGELRPRRGGRLARSRGGEC